MVPARVRASTSQKVLKGLSSTLEAELALPAVVRLHDRPVRLCDPVRVEGRVWRDLSGDCDAGDADAVVRHFGTEDGSCRPHGGFADREGGQGGNRVVGEAAA